jgi:DNA-directed RNA polymerase specialized sigma24 family protein
MLFGASHWDLRAVENCLDNYAELQEAYRDSFLGSSLRSAGESISGGGSRVYPARMNLLTSKWDIDRGIRQLPRRDRMIVHLRYHKQRSQETVARELDVHQSTISRTLRDVSYRILKILDGDA